jgi:hypothetical protein
VEATGVDADPTLHLACIWKSAGGALKFFAGGVSATADAAGADADADTGGIATGGGGGAVNHAQPTFKSNACSARLGDMLLVSKLRHGPRVLNLAENAFLLMVFMEAQLF